MMQSLTPLIRRTTRHLPRKMAALALATLVWYFAAGDSTSVSQRSLLVPITVEGLPANAVAVGLPDFAEVTLVGPTARLDRLRPESIEAVLDLDGASGAFSLPVLVAPPQGITLDRVIPNEVIGQVEPVARRELPVVVGVLGAWPDATRGDIEVTPATAVVTGLASVLAEASVVSVTLDAALLKADGSIDASGSVLDARARARPELTVEPSNFTVAWRVYVSLREKTVPLVVDAPSDPRWRLLQPLPTSIRVLGNGAAWDAVSEVRASVEWPTVEPSAGRYTAALRLMLPDGVSAVSPPAVMVEFTPAPARD